jgi:hypothetical protein
MTEPKLKWGERTRLARLSGYTQQMISYMTSKGKGDNYSRDRRRPYWHSPKLKRLCKVTGTTKDLWLDGSPEEIIAGIIVATTGTALQRDKRRE